ncbi:MAG: response regulator [Kaiparowitsia implicata GSE-PSE-MK54-09C]|jgi:CheY-like chemotaxis protein|nr:response regulator [Kaiparowitsia implicata GSE-PSE-MK54-09C]
MSEATRSVIVVEDEPLVTMLIEDMVSELGWQIAATAQTEAAALHVLEHCTPTLAILDINLGQQTSLVVAEVCRSRRIPVVFTTGYMAGDVPPECGDAPVLSKPFSLEELATALQRGLISVSESLPS